MPDSSMLPRWATQPFDNPAADIILRSSDDIDFRVRSGILCEASPFFDEIFSLARPAGSRVRQNALQLHRNGCSVISCQEDSKVIDVLLRLCYPVMDPELTSSELARAVLEAALKYQISHATAISTKALRTLLADQPARIWAIACSLNLEDEARYAASRIANAQEDQLAVFLKEMQDTTAGQYFRLLKYRRHAGQLPLPFTFISPPPPESHSQQSSRSSRSGSGFRFISRPYPDLICRSPDGVKFLTHRIILSLASPVMERLIETLSKSTGVSGHASESDDYSVHVGNHLPCIVIREDQDTLALLLHLCYSVTSPSSAMGSLDMAEKLLVIARKYKMLSAQELVEKQIQTIAESQPMSTYFTAIRLGLHDAARLAAKLMLKTNIEDIYVPEMETASALAYFRLLRFVTAAGNVVAATVKKLPIANHTSDVPSVCPHRRLVEQGRRDRTPDVACVCDWYNSYRQGVSTAMGQSSYIQQHQLEVLMKELLRHPGFCSVCLPLARAVLDLAAGERSAAEAIAKIWLDVSI